MKRRFLIVLAGALLLLFLLLPAMAETSGTCGENLTWTLENGVLMVRGTGAMADYDRSGHPSPWGTSITQVIIENGVTSIGQFAFYECYDLYDVSLPNTLTTISDYAFCKCRNLPGINLPASLQTIGVEGFWGNWSMTSITIPDSVTSLGGYAFSNCFGLERVILPDTLTHIEVCTFWGCESLVNIMLPSHLTSIGAEAFYNCYNLQTVYYNGTSDQWNAIEKADNNDVLTSVNVVYASNESGNFGTGGNNLTWTLSNWTLTISGAGAMPDYDSEERPWDAYVEEITSVVIQNGVTNIGNRAFFDM